MILKCKKLNKYEKKSLKDTAYKFSKRSSFKIKNKK